MTQKIIAPRLRAGDTVRVIAPSCSRSFVMEYDNTRWIDERFTALGLQQSFGAHVDERDEFDSSSIAHRVADLHAAFTDEMVNGVLSVIGGYNANELLPYLDFDLIAEHPKVFCGYSDITVLANAIHAKTGLVTYVGPHWSSFGMRDHFEPTGQWFHDALFEHDWQIEHASEFTDDLWFMDQDARTVLATGGPWVLNEGAAQGSVIGGNLCTLNLLQGTEWMPRLDGAVLFIEDDAAGDVHEFARQFAALLHSAAGQRLAGIAIGRFQRASGIDRALLEAVVAKHPQLAQLPVVANLDFGHTSPMFTLPIGGTARLQAEAGGVQLSLGH